MNHVKMIKMRIVIKRSPTLEKKMTSNPNHKKQKLDPELLEIVKDMVDMANTSETQIGFDTNRVLTPAEAYQTLINIVNNTGISQKLLEANPDLKLQDLLSPASIYNYAFEEIVDVIKDLESSK